MEQNLSFQYVHVSKTWSVCSFLQLLRRCSGESRAILCVATIRSNTMKIINYLHIFTTENICFCVKGHMNGLIYNTVNSWFRTCRYFIQFIFSLLLGLPCAFSAGKVLVPNFIVIGLFGFFVETEHLLSCVAAPCHFLVFTLTFTFSSHPNVSNSDKGHIPFLLKMILYLPALWVSGNLPHSLKTHPECLGDAPHNPSFGALISCHPFHFCH